MPDIRQADKYIAKLSAVEAAYLREIESERRNTRRALLDILDRDGISRAGVAEMLREIAQLETSVSRIAASNAKTARQVVQNYTRKQLQMVKRAGRGGDFDVGVLAALTAGQASDLEQGIMTSSPGWSATLATSLQSQAAQLRAAGADDAAIRARLLSETMTDGRQSIWAASGVAERNEEQRNIWTFAAGLFALFVTTAQEQEPQVEYKKQAIATLDERTTDCCLRVHGQIQPLDEPFHLTGTPRYADEMQSPPFHWYCRSVEALYLDDFEQIGIPTAKLRDAADAEIAARERTKKREIIYPSSATSRRARR